MTVEKMHQIFTHMPSLESERLLLRPLSPKDALDMYEYASGRELTKYLLWDPHPDPQYTLEYLEYLEGRYAVGDFYDWALTLKPGGKMIGTCGFTSFDLPNNSAEIGYVIHHAYQGMGYAVEAAKQVISFGFSTLGLSRISAVCMQENQKSLRVMQKLGMRLEGTLRSAILVKGIRRDISVCAITAEDFEKISATYI